MGTATPLPISVSEYLHASHRKMGVRSIWVVDPATRKGFDYSAGNWNEIIAFTVADSPIHKDLAAILAAIDEDRSR
jgi:hypothetical protein